LTDVPMLMKQVPEEERPRERLVHLGAKHLSNQELLAILISSGSKQESVLSLSQRVLMRDLKQEHFIAMFLNTKNQVIHRQTIFIGSLNASIVHPREVYKEAVKRSAASVICAHNHPSGDPTPSQEDIHVTRRLTECGKMLGIELLDHLVIGDRNFVSLKEKGYL